jgi:ABC-type glycerol-3-phosphate transport system substrate-binding protein
VELKDKTGGKIMRKALLIIITISMVLTSFTACKGKTTDDAKTLNIYLVEKGYGRAWLDELAKEFSIDNNGATVNIKTTTYSDLIRTKLQSGAKNDSTDLFFTTDYVDDLIADDLSKPANERKLEELTDVYSAIPTNETKSVKDKMNKSYKRFYEKADGRYFSFPWVQGMDGLIYNKTVLEKAIGTNYKLPNTTNELIAFANSIKKAGKSAFIHSGDVQYWYFCYLTWWAQYQGLDDYLKFYQGKYKDYSNEYARGQGMFLQPGRLECLKVLEEIVKPENGLTEPKSNSYSFSEAQTYFMLGNAVMMSNGDWLANEMKENSENSDIRFMKTPVISSLIKTLKTIKDDKTLSAVVNAIDKNETSYNNVSEDDFNKVKKARYLVNTISFGHNAFIPTYSNAKDLAKKFLVFMASDKGQKTYTKALKGVTLPFGYNVKNDADLYNGFSSLLKSAIDISQNAEYVYVDYTSPLVYKGGLVPFNLVTNGSLEMLLSTTDPKLKKTAQQIYDYNYTSYTGNNASAWTDLLRRAGLV